MPNEQKYLVRCMGGRFCRHAPGTCTATTVPNEQTESQSDVEALAALVKYHQSGGHEGDGSDENLARCAAALSTLPRDPQGLVEALRRISGGTYTYLENGLRAAIPIPARQAQEIASAALAAWEAGK